MADTAEQVLAWYLKQKNLKLTRQRRRILHVFMSEEAHLSTDELYRKVHTMYPEIGHTTVFRTLKLLEEAGIARSVELGDRRVRYEHKFQHAHHDHLICRYCGASFEVFDSEIERLQNELCRRNSFRPEAHRLEIFGMCARCAELRRSNQ